jgi:opacity protein-like surface antigen
MRWKAMLILPALLQLTTPSYARDTDGLRGYLAARLGLAAGIDSDVGAGLEATTIEQVVGVSAGVNINRYLGVELAGDGWERNMRLDRTVGEFAIYTVAPFLRLRYPMLDGGVTPYALVGVGVGYTEFNDRKRPGFDVDVGGKSWGVAGGIGGGVDYFVANNIAIGLEMKYLVLRNQDIRFNGRRRALDLDTVLVSAGIRFLFPEAQGR